MCEKNIDNLILKPLDELQLLDVKLNKRNFFINLLKQNLYYKFYNLLNTFIQTDY